MAVCPSCESGVSWTEWVSYSRENPIYCSNCGAYCGIVKTFLHPWYFIFVGVIQAYLLHITANIFLSILPPFFLIPILYIVVEWRFAKLKELKPVKIADEFQRA